MVKECKGGVKPPTDRCQEEVVRVLSAQNKMRQAGSPQALALVLLAQRRSQTSVRTAGGNVSLGMASCLAKDVEDEQFFIFPKCDGPAAPKVEGGVKPPHGECLRH